MKTQLIPSAAHTTTHWSGGSTTQLFIHPASSNVAERNFEIRISTAKVEVNESTFTPFVGFDRTLLILDGSIQISHEGHHEKVLKPFDQDFFKGDWSTKSVGIGVDFNVITKPEFSNTTEVLMISKGEEVTIEGSSYWLIFYLFKGAIEVNKEYLLQQGDVLVVEESERDMWKVITEEESVVIVVKIGV
ncbi:HutD family protein [bacterium]|nr:HutD family protein [bacterium]